MKILQLCNRVPFPANDGGNIAMLSIADALISQGVDYKMLALNTVKHHADISSLSAEQKSRYKIEAVDVDTTVKVFPAVRNLFSSGSYNVDRFDSEEFHKLLTTHLQKHNYTAIILESIFMCPYIKTIRHNSNAKIILRAHNIEHIIWQRLAGNEKYFFKSKYLKLLSERIRKYELAVINKVDAIVPITSEDEHVFKKLGATVSLHTVPVALNMEDYESQIDPTSPLVLFHLGAMDWIPNLEGVKWFLNSCWLLIHESFPSLRLFLAGRGFPEPLKSIASEGVTCEGEILHAKNYMHGKQIMVVPLKSGGGMRVKIIQGMALGKTIISTSIGAEGINYKESKEVLIADTPSEFLQKVSKCVNDKQFCFSIGANAREFALQNYSIESVGQKLMSFITKLTAENKTTETAATAFSNSLPA